MVASAQEAIGYAAGRSRGDLASDRQLEHSLVRLVGIVGEAAGRLSPATRAMAPELPWPSMVSMRNRLIHDYDRVDLNVVWDTVTVDLPGLVPQLERLVEAVENSSTS
jgi:uncharacterized protein with HEPN domain